MDVAERTYSFRAASSLGERMKDVRQTLGRVSSGEDGELTEKFARELVLALLRRSDLDDLRNSQSAFMRAAIEVLAAAAEKVASDAHYTRVYAGHHNAEQHNSAGTDAAARRGAAKHAAARRWRAR